MSAAQEWDRPSSYAAHLETCVALTLLFGHLQKVGRAVMIRGVDKEFHILFKTQDLRIYAAISGNTIGNGTTVHENKSRTRTQSEDDEHV
jgi:hypothetical protein